MVLHQLGSDQLDQPNSVARPEDELGAWTMEIRGHQVHFDVFSGLDPALGRWALRKPNSR